MTFFPLGAACNRSLVTIVANETRAGSCGCVPDISLGGPRPRRNCQDLVVMGRHKRRGPLASLLKRCDRSSIRVDLERHIVSRAYGFRGGAPKMSPNNRFERSRGNSSACAKEGVDDWDQVPSIDAGETPRRSTSSLGAKLAWPLHVARSLDCRLRG